MEESNFDGTWNMRQTAVYHNLDLYNGRTFWLIVKANDVARERVRESSSVGKNPTGVVPTEMEDCIGLALRTHLSMMAWSCEGWRWHITNMEQESRSRIAKVTAKSIESYQSLLDPNTRLLVKSLSLPRSGTFQSTNPIHDEETSVPATSGNVAFKGIVTSQVEASRLDTSEDVENRKAQVDLSEKRLNILRGFSIGGHLSLARIANKAKKG
ncbi:hypothetical protein AB5N19_10483 [Seiridium cardinale]